MRRYAIISLALLLVAAANAAIVYAPNGLPRPYPFGGPDQLIRFDTNNPSAYTVVGSMNVPNIGFGGMDFDQNGNLWAYASFYKDNGGAAAGLYSVDINTGAATPVGFSVQTLEDLAFNPVNNQMYGIRSQGNITRLYHVNLTTGFVSNVGTFTGLPSQVQRSMGFAIDSLGNYYIQDMGVDKIYKGGANLAMTELYTLSQDTSFSQGMTIDWARDNKGYHAAVGYGVFPEYFSQINTFNTDGSAYTLGPDFGPNEWYDSYSYPPVQAGDLAINPIPEPAALALLALGVLLRRR